MIRFITPASEINRLYPNMTKKEQLKAIRCFYKLTCKYSEKHDCFMLFITHPVPLPFLPCAMFFADDEEIHLLQEETARHIGGRMN